MCSMSGASCALTRSIFRRASRGASNDPDFAAKAAEIVGLYLPPPENAIVICVDEKPSIQALERAQGYLKFPNGRALSGQSHDDKRGAVAICVGICFSVISSVTRLPDQAASSMICSSLYLILQTASFWRWPVHCRWWSGSDHFFPRNRDGVKECLQRRLAEAPAALMRALLVVAFDP